MHGFPFRVRLSRSLGEMAIAVAVVLLVAVTFASSAPGAEAATAPYKVAVSAASEVIAGSTGNVITFKFTATLQTAAPVSVVIPAVASGGPWSAPQMTAPSAAGYVYVTGRTCGLASIASITGSAGGPWTILVKTKCALTKKFSLVYGSVGPGVTAATTAGTYTFTVTAKYLTKTVTVPGVKKVTVDAAAFTHFTDDVSFSGSPSIDGAEFVVGQIAKVHFVVSARDVYGNLVPYLDTIHFTFTPTQPSAPSRLATASMINGTATYDTLYTIPDTGGSLSLQAKDPSNVGVQAAVGWSHAAVPATSVVHLLNMPVVNDPNNPIYFTALNMQVQPGSLTLTSNASMNANGTVDIPVSGLTVGGDHVAFTVTTSTPVNPITGNLVLDPTTLPRNGQSLVVTSCIGLPSTIPYGSTTLPAFNFGSGTCSGGFVPTDINAPNVPSIWPQTPMVEAPVGVGGEASSAFTVFLTASQPQCVSPNPSYWDGQKCVDITG